MKYETCGPYILLEKLASGGMAEVYLAKASGAEGVSKFLAVKKILPQYTSNDEFIDMFKSEAKISININHVNIVPIYQFGESNKQFYLAMEFVSGKNLRQIISKIKKQGSQIPVEHIVFIINEVAKGLDYAHRFIDKLTGKPLNIIHRDMSPQNIMLSYEGEVKIVDFGIAKAESKLEATQAGTLKGKFGYMSPEQVEGLELDCRTDIFSLGIILWELLANDRLFIANNEVNTIKKIKECHVPPLSRLNTEVKEELEQIVNKSLARDRSLRYQSASEMHRDLNRYLNKHFSDYAAQDFAQYIKQMYLTEIMEIRENLVKFAKVQIDTEEANEATRTITQTASEASPVEKIPDLSTNDIDFKDSISLDESSINFKKKNSSLVSLSNYTNGTHTSYTVTSNKSTKKNIVSMILSLVLLVFSAYLYTDPEALNEVKNQFGLNDKTNRVLTSTTQTKVLQTSNYSFYVKSSPPGARIYINEKDTGFYTPGKIAVKPNTVFDLTLRKTGYLDYRKQIIATANGQQFQASIQKSKVGYLSIFVPSPNVDIYINNRKISEKPPITKYAIQAATRVNIKAVNPYTKAVDQVTVRVRQDTHQRINLFPKKR